MLSWLIDHAEGEEREVRSLVLRLLVLGFAAIHTSTMVMHPRLFAVTRVLINLLLGLRPRPLSRSSKPWIRRYSPTRYRDYSQGRGMVKEFDRQDAQSRQLPERMPTLLFDWERYV